MTGAQIEKTTNKEACRDLSGRRLRDINQEKRLQEQIEKRAEKERERIANRKKKFEKMKEQPKHVFSDDKFYKEQEAISQSLFDSVDKGLKVAAENSFASQSDVVTATPSSSGCSSGSDSNTKGTSAVQGVKRKSNAESSKSKKKGRFFDDLDDSSDDSD